MRDIVIYRRRASLGCAVVKCHTHNYHNLNFSDHLPLSISLQLNAAAEVVCSPKVKINWPKSVERNLIYEYSLEVSNIVSQFLSLKDQSVAEINHEVLFVSNAIVQAASKHLTAASRYKKKAYIKDEQLRKLCKESRDVWEQWKVAGCPSEVSFCEKKHNSKKLVRQYVYSCRAKLERAEIQSRDGMFKDSHNRRFRYFRKHTECRGLMVNDQIQTDPADIARHFRNFFENLSTSSPSSDLASVKSTIPDLENKSFMNSEDILDTLITFEEIEGVLKSLKLGRSGGMDCLDPQHMEAKP